MSQDGASKMGLLAVLEDVDTALQRIDLSEPGVTTTGPAEVLAEIRALKVLVRGIGMLVIHAVVELAEKEAQSERRTDTEER